MNLVIIIALAKVLEEYIILYNRIKLSSLIPTAPGNGSDETEINKTD